MNGSSQGEYILKVIHIGETPTPVHVLVLPSEWEEYLGLSVHKCECVRTALRAKTIKNGRIQWKQQCLRCGSSASSAVAQNAELKVAPWDEELPISFEASLKTQRRALELTFLDRTANMESGLDVSYQEYLRSPEWKRKRNLVLKRDNNICQGCLVNEAEEVHHFHYEDVPNELLFDLISVCSGCHARIHQKHIEKRKKLRADFVGATDAGELQ